MRNLDHFVMPVANLASARARYSALGFTVANNARHPFGTENCCVFLSDTTFIEPLAIGDLAVYQNALAAGNTFVSGRDTYCQAVAPEGFSHLVVQSANSRADHEAFIGDAISGGDILDFGRTFTKPDGSQDEVAFSLAFAREPNSPSASFFACEVVKFVPGGRGSLIDHVNGALGCKRVVLSAANPTAHASFLERFLNAECSTTENGISFATKTGSVEVLTGEACLSQYAIAPHRVEGLCLEALVLYVSNLERARDLLAKNMVSVQDSAKRITVLPPALGQGGTLIFEE